MDWGEMALPADRDHVWLSYYVNIQFSIARPYFDIFTTRVYP